MFFKRKKINNSQEIEKDLKLKKLQLKAIGDVTDVLAGVINQKEVLDLIIDKLTKNLGYKFSGTFLFNEQKNGLYNVNLSIPDSFIKILDKGLGMKHTEIKFGLDLKKNVMIRSFIDNEITEGNDMYYFISHVNKSVARVLQKGMGVDLMLAIPLRIKKQPIGLLAIGTSVSKIDQEEKELLLTFANQAAIAIYNARLFSQVESQVQALDAKAKDLQALLDVSQVAISKLQSANVLQEILNAVPEKFSHLGYVGGIFLKYNSQKSTFLVNAITDGEVIKTIQKIAKIDLFDKSQEIGIEEDEKNPLFQCTRLRKFVKFEDTSKFISTSRVKKIVVKKAQKALGVKSGILIPVILRDDLQGVLLIGTAKPVSEIKERHEEIMKTFANNLSLAYENVELVEKLKARLEELKEANIRLKMLDEAKTNFVSITSHQLRTPIAGVKGYLSMLYEGDFGEMTAKQKEILQMNLANIERLVKLIDLFLDISKIEAGKLTLDEQDCDLVEVIDGAIKQFSNQLAIQKHLKLVFYKPKEKSRVVCDSERMYHVVANLIDNAIKYTPEGQITVELLIKKDKEIIKVSDTGIGLDTKEAGRLFDKFVRAEGGYRLNANGSGLGLYIVKKIVEGHGGKVFVESEGEGKGSTFFVELEKNNKKLKKLNK